MEHPNEDPHERPQDPRRVYKELSQETPPDTTPANSPEFKVPLPPIRRKNTRSYATPAFFGIWM